MTLLYLAVAILCEVAATLSLKGSATVPALYVVVVLGYLGGFVFLTVVLKRGDGTRRGIRHLGGPLASPSPQACRRCSSVRRSPR